MPVATSLSPSPARTKHVASPQKTPKPQEDFTKVRASTEIAATALNPPKAAKVPTAVANYQTRWEREKAKARAEGTSIEPKDPKMIGPWIIGEMLGRGASGTSIARLRVLVPDPLSTRSCPSRSALCNWQDGRCQNSQSAPSSLLSFISARECR
jgi:hypothetical protein